RLAYAGTPRSIKTIIGRANVYQTGRVIWRICLQRRGAEDPGGPKAGMPPDRLFSQVNRGRTRPASKAPTLAAPHEEEGSMITSARFLGLAAVLGTSLFGATAIRADDMAAAGGNNLAQVRSNPVRNDPAEER